MMHRLIEFVKSPIVRWIVGVTLLMSALLIRRPIFTQFLELKLYDLKFRFRGSREAGKQVAIVAIDDDSVKAVGRWPWSREDMARLLSAIKKAGPRVIALDIIFAEREQTASYQAINNLRQELGRRKVSPKLLEILDVEGKKADVDRQLAAVINRDSPTILGYYFRDLSGRTGGVKAEKLMGSHFLQATTYNIVRLRDTKPSQVRLVSAAGVEQNIPVITKASRGDGYFNMIPDPDGAVRWFPMTVMYDGEFFAPLSLVALSRFEGDAPLAITLSRWGVDSVRVGSQSVPVDRYGRMLINYLGPGGIIPTYSATAVLNGTLPPGALKDKIVLVGATAVGIYDLRVTPFSGNFPGVEVQATIMDNLLRGNFIRTPPFGLAIMLLILIGLAIMLGRVLPRLSAAWALIFTLVVIEGYVGVNYYL
ncbi:MAG TPA: CHASE2 domain-containing protein, partial [Desulfobaccales bacterium]|nr:CHASE2 domain-containing protein [Desulfobaccales bacterium]